MKDRQEITNFNRPTPKVGECYRHWKEGRLYEVRAISRMTGYEPLKGEELITYTYDGFTVYTRTTVDFLCSIQNDDGKYVERFTKVV